jgi:hypothetical protein
MGRNYSAISSINGESGKTLSSEAVLMWLTQMSGGIVFAVYEKLIEGMTAL